MVWSKDVQKMSSMRDLNLVFLLLGFIGSQAFLLPPQPHHQVSSWRAGSSRPLLAPLEGVKGVHTFDSSFTLNPQVQEKLDGFLAHPDMIKLVVQEAKCTDATYAGFLFQPVPYSLGTRFGMPQQYEEYHNNPDYAICNVPPVVMFNARVFKPSRLCAIYRIEGLDPEERVRVLERRENMKPAPPVTEEEEHDMLQDYGVGGAALNQEEEKWTPVGEAIRQLALEPGAFNEEDDDADLDAMVV